MTVSCVHSAVISSSSSFIRAPRSRWGIPTASNSRSIQPTPTPRIERPPDSTSSVAHCFANWTGSRNGSTSTSVPRLIERVTPASADSSVIGSSHVVRYAGGATSRWSISIALSKPRSSAWRRYAPISASDAVCSPSAKLGSRRP